MKLKKLLTEILLSIVGLAVMYFALMTTFTLYLIGRGRYNLYYPPLNFFQVLLYFLFSLIPSAAWFFVRWLLYKKGLVGKNYRIATNIICASQTLLGLTIYGSFLFQSLQHSWFVDLECIGAVICFALGLLLDYVLMKHYRKKQAELNQTTTPPEAPCEKTRMEQ